MYRDGLLQGVDFTKRIIKDEINRKNIEKEQVTEKEEVVEKENNDTKMDKFIRPIRENKEELIEFDMEL